MTRGASEAAWHQPNQDDGDELSARAHHEDGWLLGKPILRTSLFLLTLANTRVPVVLSRWASTVGPRPSHVVGLLLGRDV